MLINRRMQKRKHKIQKESNEYKMKKSYYCHMQVHLSRKYISTVILLSQLYKSIFHSSYLTYNISYDGDAIIWVFYFP